VGPVLAGFLAAGGSLGAQDRAHQLAQQAASQHPVTSSNHASFSTGLREGNLYAAIAYPYFAEDTGQSCPGEVSEYHQ
jgi:hypothetical protein